MVRSTPWLFYHWVSDKKTFRMVFSSARQIWPAHYNRFAFRKYILFRSLYNICVISSLIFPILISNRPVNFPWNFSFECNQFFLISPYCEPCLTCAHYYIGRIYDVYSFSIVPLDSIAELSILFITRLTLFALFTLNWISLCMLFFVFVFTHKYLKSFI